MYFLVNENIELENGKKTKFVYCNLRSEWDGERFRYFDEGHFFGFNRVARDGFSNFTITMLRTGMFDTISHPSPSPHFEINKIFPEIANAFSNFHKITHHFTFRRHNLHFTTNWKFAVEENG